MKSKELRPCPFCGGRHAEVMSDLDEYREIWGGGFDWSGLEPTGCKAVVCKYDEGGCGAAGGYRRTAEEAADAWNRRAGGGRIAELEALVRDMWEAFALRPYVLANPEALAGRMRGLGIGPCEKEES